MYHSFDRLVNGLTDRGMADRMNLSHNNHIFRKKNILTFFLLFRGFRNPGMIQVYIPQSVRDKAVPFRNTNVITDTQSSGFLKIIECTSNKHLSNTKNLGNKINSSLTGSDEKSNSISSRQPLI